MRETYWVAEFVKRNAIPGAMEKIGFLSYSILGSRFHGKPSNLLTLHTK